MAGKYIGAALLTVIALTESSTAQATELQVTAIGAFEWGQTAIVQVSGAAPGETVLLAVSSAGEGAGPCPPQLGGQCLGLLPPLMGDSARADAAGTAYFLRQLPPNGPSSVPVSLQAAVVRGVGGSASVLSDPLTVTIDDVCQGVTCSGHGVCVDGGGTPTCNCDYGYSVNGLNCVSTYTEPLDLGSLGGQSDCTQILGFPFESSASASVSQTFQDHVNGGRPGGIDYAAARGTPVYAVAWGTVIEIEKNAPDNPQYNPCPATGSGWGNYVKYRLQYDEYVIAAHFQAGSVPASLTVGSVVQPGQLLGRVGNSGYTCSTNGGDGSHLHHGHNSTGWIDPQVCTSSTPTYGNPATQPPDCFDGDLDTYGDGSFCRLYDCDDNDGVAQSVGMDGCTCLSAEADGGQCLDRDGDGAFAGTSCPVYDEDCDDHDPSVSTTCGPVCASAGTVDVFVDTVNAFNGPFSISAGHFVDLDFYMGNAGSVDAGDTQYRVYVSTDATVTTGDTPVNGLLSPLTRSAAAMTAGSRNYGATAFPASYAGVGTWYVGIIVDPNNLIAESDETNNVAIDAVPITILP